MSSTIIKQNVQQLVDQWLEAERDGNPFPVPFDLAWQIAGYSRKDSAKRKLPKRLQGIHFHISVEMVDRPQGGGKKQERQGFN